MNANIRIRPLLDTLKPKLILVQLVQHFIIMIGTAGVVSVLLLTNTARLYTGLVYAAAFILLLAIRYIALMDRQPRVNIVLLGGLWSVYTVYALLTGGVNAVTM